MKELLKQNFSLLRKQLNLLEKSYDKCSQIGLKENYNDEEFESFEVLCSRYGRGIDFLIRKVFRTIDMYEFENQGTLIDIVNNAHKRGLFDDIDKLRMMKDVRNSIAHEYIEENLIEFFDEVLEYSKELIEIMNNTLSYIQKNYPEIFE